MCYIQGTAPALHYFPNLHDFSILPCEYQTNKASNMANNLQSRSNLDHFWPSTIRGTKLVLRVYRLVIKVKGVSQYDRNWKLWKLSNKTALTLAHYSHCSRICQDECFSLVSTIFELVSLFCSWQIPVTTGIPELLTYSSL